MIVKFTIPGPPEGKRRPRVDGRGQFVRVHTHKADIAREKLITGIVRDAMRGAAVFTGPVAVYVEAVFEVPRSYSKAATRRALDGYWFTGKPDKDNIEKSILDSLNPPKKGEPFCLTDDAQVCAGGTIKRYGSPTRTEVTIMTLEPPASAVEQAKLL